MAFWGTKKATALVGAFIGALWALIAYLIDAAPETHAVVLPFITAGLALWRSFASASAKPEAGKGATTLGVLFLVAISSGGCASALPTRNLTTVQRENAVETVDSALTLASSIFALAGKPAVRDTLEAMRPGVVASVAASLEYPLPLADLVGALFDAIESACDEAGVSISAVSAAARAFVSWAMEHGFGGSIAVE